MQLRGVVDYADAGSGANRRSVASTYSYAIIGN